MKTVNVYGGVNVGHVGAYCIQQIAYEFYLQICRAGKDKDLWISAIECFWVRWIGTAILRDQVLNGGDTAGISKRSTALQSTSCKRSNYRRKWVPVTKRNDFHGPLWFSRSKIWKSGNSTGGGQERRERELQASPKLVRRDKEASADRTRMWWCWSQTTLSREKFAVQVGRKRLNEEIDGWFASLDKRRNTGLKHVGTIRTPTLTVAKQGFFRNWSNIPHVSGIFRIHFPILSWHCGFYDHHRIITETIIRLGPIAWHTRTCLANPALNWPGKLCWIASGDVPLCTQGGQEECSSNKFSCRSKQFRWRIYGYNQCAQF